MEKYYFEILKAFTEDSLKTIGDHNALKYMWITKPERGVGPDEVTLSFLEICRPIVETSEKFDLSKEEVNVLSNLLKMVENYNPYEDFRSQTLKVGETVLNDPKWLKIMECAAIAYKMLSKKVQK